MSGRFARARSVPEQALRSIRSLVPARARRIHFIRTFARNYTDIEMSVAGGIFAHLPPRSVEDARLEDDHRGALTFSLFIGDAPDVLMSHGLADKRYLHRRDPETRERMVNRCGHLLVPGEWTKRRVLKSKDVELTPEQVHIVGWPRLDLLLERQRELTASDVPFGQRRPRVLWAPTHDYVKRGLEQESTSTYPAFEAHLPALREHADVEVSVHPRNRKDKTPTHDQLLWTDYVVSDFGTMVYEAWALGKPVIFPAWILGGRIVRYMKYSTEAHIFREGIGLHPTSIDDLMDLVRAGNRTPGDDVTDFMADYLEPATYGCSGQRAAAVLDALRRGVAVPY